MVRALCLVCLCLVARDLTAGPDEARRDHLLEVSQRYVGIQEATGRNDGPVIERMQKFTGGEKGEPYCIDYLVTTGHEAGLIWMPITGYTPTLFQGAASAPFRIQAGELQPGDDVGLSMYVKKEGKYRLAHGLRLKEKHGNWWLTVEANTSPEAQPGTEADRNGDGIWNRRRPAKLIEQRNNKFCRFWRKP